MATSTTQVVSTKASKVYIGTADDPAGTYSTGDISGTVKNWALTITASTSDETVINSDIGQTHKEISDISGSLTWRAGKTARNRAVDFALQDGSKEYPIRFSPDGIGTGERFYAGTVLFVSADPSGTAKSPQSVSSPSIMFNTWEVGTHA